MKNKKIIAAMIVTALITIIFSVILNTTALNYGSLTYEINNGKVTITGCDKEAAEVFIPEKIEGKPVAFLGYFAFKSCEKLTKIDVDSNNSYFSSYDGVLYNKDKTVLLRCPEGKSSVAVYNKVKIIGNESFAFCKKLTQVNLPGTVEEIGYYAFDTCVGLTKIVIPDSVITIGMQAFEYCINITEIKLGKSIKRINHYAFSSCNKVTVLTVPDSVEYMGAGVLPSNYIDSLPDGPVYLGKMFYAYKGEMPENTEIVIKNGTKGIAGGAFSGYRNLIKVTMPESVIEIGESAFVSCEKLGSAALPSKITKIYAGTFSDCKALTSVTIPEGVTEIQREAFTNCLMLDDIYVPDTIAVIGSNAFYNTKWYNELDEGLVYIGKVVLGYKGGINRDTEITIENGTRGIADGAFFQQIGFPEIVLPESIEYIGSDAFYYAYITIKNPNVKFGKHLAFKRRDDCFRPRQYLAAVCAGQRLYMDSAFLGSL
ncbi:MAG: leucine-rich repeat domain-containing protein [Acutalibacteraceae bacterium]